MFKNVQFFSLFVVFLAGCGGGGSNSTSGGTDNSGGSTNNTVYSPNLTLYGPLKTGKIIYKTKTISDYGTAGSGETIGTERFVFKDWGNVHLTEVEDENTVKIIDQNTGAVTTSVESSHDLKKWITPKKYDVNFKKEIINVLDFSSLYQGLTAEAIADSLKPTVGDNVSYVGKDVVLGYVCDVYQVGVVTLCLFNNVTLKSEVDLGTFAKSTTVATSITFNTYILEDEFKLPSFTHVNIN